MPAGRNSSRERLPVPRFLSLLLVCLLGRPAPALAQLEVQGFLGTSVSAPSPLWVTQRGQPALDFTAHWATRPFLDTWYYAGRIGLWSGNRGWLFDFTHHKIYLSNPPAEIQRFQITNGMNMFTLSRGFRRGPFSYALGAGPVVTYPINRVREQKLQGGRGFLGGYFLSGGNLMASATRRFPRAAGHARIRPIVKWKVAPWPTMPSAHTRPPWRWMIRCTVASPIPVPGNSLARCSRWKGPNS